MPQSCSQVHPVRRPLCKRTEQPPAVQDADVWTLGVRSMILSRHKRKQTTLKDRDRFAGGREANRLHHCWG